MNVTGQPCLICSKKADSAHIKSRGSGGGDDEWNIIRLCRRHHIESHQYGWKKFCEVYPIIEDVLILKGWAFVLEFGQMKLRRILEDQLENG